MEPDWIALFARLRLAPAIGCVGSRQPVADAPVWATLEVAPGGFATGRLLAELNPHKPRNEFFLTDEGVTGLGRMLQTGLYRVKYPEHGALLAIAWLLRAGMEEQAVTLYTEIRPMFDRLQFYPEPALTPINVTENLFVQPVAELRRRLEGYAQRTADLRLHRNHVRVVRVQAVQMWHPILYQLLSLFAKTVECEHMPAYQLDPHGKILCDGRRPLFQNHPTCACDLHPRKTCGWPLQRFPPNWQEEARAVMTLLDKTTRDAIRTRRSVGGKRGTAFHTLTECLRVCCAKGPRAVSGRMVGLLRAALAGWETKHGLPPSPRFAAFVAAQPAPRCSSAAFVPVLLERLNANDAERGVSDLDEVLQPVMIADVTLPVPATLVRKVQRARETTLQQLLGMGAVTSSEALAMLVPVLAASRTSMAIADPALRTLSFAVRVAFEARRSLLLLNLEQQVQLHELPWAQPLLALSAVTATSVEAARGALELVVRSALTSFPQTILPNKLLRSLRPLADAMQCAVPLTDELAADIFMGEFSDKFVQAAVVTARLCGTGLYAAYYGLRDAFAVIMAEPNMSAKSFSRMCFNLAGVPWQDDRRYGYQRPSVNGKIIERQQLLTSHNLATLIVVLELQLDWAALAMQIWTWMHRVLALPVERLHRHVLLGRRKRVAYAWRQLVFFLSLLPHELQVSTMDAMVAGVPRAPPHVHAHCVEFFLAPLRRIVDDVAAGRMCELEHRMRVFGWVVWPDDGEQVFFPPPAQ